ncbi:hypothetical protein [Aeromonas dhakensis]|uniref:hypothetical protein n=1 Tax=Aeromonas dhakensis TaxID=196024 RepID=UPI002B49CCBC|nr:hypothetical protein [Aeromonas dhakensis]
MLKLNSARVAVVHVGEFLGRTLNISRGDIDSYVVKDTGSPVIIDKDGNLSVNLASPEFKAAFEKNMEQLEVIEIRLKDKEAV